MKICNGVFHAGLCHDSAHTTVPASAPPGAS